MDPRIYRRRAPKQCVTSRPGHMLRGLLCALFGAAILAGSGGSAARALSIHDLLLRAAASRQVHRALDTDDLALRALMAEVDRERAEDREVPVPLITPRRITGTPAPAGSDLRCLSLLWAEGMAYEEVEHSSATEGIATPVRIPEAGIGGVRYRYYYAGKKPTVIDCRLALALVRAAPVLRANGVAEVIFLNHYRPSFGRFGPGQYTFHSQGLAMDVWGFVTLSGKKLLVSRDYETGLGFMDPDSCLGRPMTMRGMLLRKIACDLDASDAFEAILTPDYDAQHWNHFHLSAFHSRQASLLRPRGTALLEVPVTDLTAWALTRSIRQQPQLRRWDDVAARPWPERFRSFHAALGIRPKTDAELVADLTHHPSLVGQVWSGLVALADELLLELDDMYLEQLRQPLEEVFALLPSSAEEISAVWEDLLRRQSER